MGLYLLSLLVSGGINYSKSRYVQKKMQLAGSPAVNIVENMPTSKKLLTFGKAIFLTVCPIVNIINSIDLLLKPKSAIYKKWSEAMSDNCYVIDEQLKQREEAEESQKDKESERREAKKVESREPKKVERREPSRVKTREEELTEIKNYYKAEYIRYKKLYEDATKNGKGKEVKNILAKKANYALEEYNKAKAELESLQLKKKQKDLVDKYLTNEERANIKTELYKSEFYRLKDAYKDAQRKGASQKELDTILANITYLYNEIAKEESKKPQSQNPKLTMKQNQ